MNPSEAVMLTRYVRALCPHQKFDDYTPEAWLDVLGAYSLDDCRAAVKNIIGNGNAFVGVAEIITEVKRLRTERLANSDLAIPSVDPADEQAYRQQLGRIMRQLGDGPMPFRAIEGGKGKAAPNKAFKGARSAEDNERVLGQTIACPVEWCSALAGQPCVSQVHGKPLAKGHPSRVKAARSEAS